MSKYRPTEFHYYDWDFNNWFGSETRANCRALVSDLPMGLIANAAEGAYRNLLDYCYKQGDIPGDLGGMAALCGMSPEVFELVWPAFRKKFSAHKSKPNRLVHDKVSIRRRAWKQKKFQTSDAGAKSASKRRINNATAINEMDNERGTPVQRESAFVHHEIGNRKKEIGNRKDAAAVAAEQSAQQLGPRYEPFEEVDRTQLAKQVVADLAKEHPTPGGIHYAEAAVERVMANCVDPSVLSAAIRKNHAAYCEYWAERRKTNQALFIPNLAKWFNDGDYMHPPPAMARSPSKVRNIAAELEAL